MGKILARAPGFFKMVRFGGLVAQLVEQCPFKALVRGSSPRQPTIPPVGGFAPSADHGLMQEPWSFAAEDFEGGNLLRLMLNRKAFFPRRF